MCRNDQVIAKVNGVMMWNHHVTTQEIADKVVTSTFVKNSIVTEYLALKTVMAKFMPKLLMASHRIY
jgi:hypothetical protein